MFSGKDVMRQCNMLEGILLCNIMSHRVARVAFSQPLSFGLWLTLRLFIFTQLYKVVQLDSMPEIEAFYINILF